MYCAPPKPEPKPAFEGGTLCKHCGATYKPGNWWRGYYEGTSDYFNPVCKINGCPVCGKPAT